MEKCYDWAARLDHDGKDRGSTKEGYTVEL